MKREITLNNISVGAYMRHFNEDGTTEYVEFNDMAKAIFENEDVPNSPFWRQELEDINDRDVLQSSVSFTTDYPIIDDTGKVFKWLAFTKNKVVDSKSGTYIVTTIVDETERKQNEALIEEQNGFLEAMYKYLPVGVERMDLNGKIVYVNEKICEILGIKSKNEILGLVVFDDPNFPKEIENRMLSLENDLSFQKEYDFGLINKKKFYQSFIHGTRILKHRYTIIFNNNNEPTGFLGITEDVTDSVHKQNALDLTQKNLSLVLENGKMSTWNYDVHRRVFSVFKGIDSTKDEISYEEHFDELLYPEYLENSKLSFDNVVMGITEHGGNVYKTHDPVTGKAVYRKTSFIGIRNDGVITNVIGTSHDVTDLYSQQEELLKSKEELNLALEAGDLSAWIYNVDKQMFFTLYGKTIAGNGLTLSETFELLHPDDREKMSSFLNAIIDGSSAHEVSIFRFKSEDIQGGYRYYDSRILGRLDNGRVSIITGTQKDVTEDYLHQLQLEEFNLKTNLINDACNMVQFDYDLKKHVINTYSSNSILPGEDITLEKYLEYVHPDDHAKLIEIFKQGDNRKIDKFSISMRLILPESNGEYRPVISDGVALKDKDGVIIKYTGIRRDMSQWEKLNEQLKEQNVINKLIIDNINVGLTFFDTDCRVRWTNFQKGSSMIRKMGLKDFSSGDYCQFLVNGKCTGKVCQAKVAFATKKLYEEELSFKNGLYIDASANPVFDDDGKVIGSILKFRDITDRKKMDIALNKAKEDAILTNQILNIILARIPGALFIKDASDGFRYYIANDMYCNTLGRTIAQVIGKTDYDIFDNESADFYHEYDKALVEGMKDSVSYERKVSIRGKTIYWQISKSMVKADDGRTLILGVASDVTSIKEANIEMQEAKIKAESSDNLKSAFLANMSHEIRTPLNAIVGFSDLLTETNDPHEKSEYCKIITNNSEMLLRLIGDILDLSKIESGNTDFRRTLTNVASYFDELTSSLAQRVINPDVKFIVENPYSTCYVTLDKDRFGQIISNFVTNAIKYTPSGYIKVGYIIENNGIKVYV